MREILFRGKRLDNGEWVEGGSIIRFDPENGQDLVFMPHMHEGCTSTHDDKDNITAFESGMFYKVDPATVGQYNGMKDKHGKKIFEGDIVILFETNSGVVVYDDNSAGFAIPGDGCGLCVSNANEREVIGNIHDNPELMGGESNA